MPGMLSTLAKDTPNSLWKETDLEGMLTAYPLNTAGMITSVTYQEDLVGNRHTYSYSSGRLATLQDAVGRVVSFAYNGNNVLESIQDWAGRRTSFLYDTATVAGKPLLTTVTGPSGCQTQYGYATFTLDTAVNPAGTTATPKDRGPQRLRDLLHLRPAGQSHRASGGGNGHHDLPLPAGRDADR